MTKAARYLQVDSLVKSAEHVAEAARVAVVDRSVRVAFPTAVNDQITDSVTQACVKILGDAPGIAMGNLFQATAQALANAAHNATHAQQQSCVIAQAATTMGVATLYALAPASARAATKEIPHSEEKEPG